tara:strand:- start:43 stop:558 length:516 start_codon:yes stop_codon:yes gene_type:complete
MRTKLIISANGPDRKGIVSEISSIINSHQGNIETSRMIRLINEFAVLILIDINENDIPKLNSSLDKIKQLNVNLIKTENNSQNLEGNKFHLYINGADNEGIVYQFSNYFTQINASIEEVKTEIKNAPISATPLFMMDVIIQIIEEKDITTILEELHLIADKLGVEIHLKKI